jgi:hypothetical protein
MKTSSAKAKGRRLCQIVRDSLLKKFTQLQPADIVVTSSGDTGEDLKLSPFARNLFPISIECKNHAKFSVYKHYEQAKRNAKQYEPMVVIKQNNSDPLVIISLDFLMTLL